MLLLRFEYVHIESIIQEWTEGVVRFQVEFELFKFSETSLESFVEIILACFFRYEDVFKIVIRWVMLMSRTRWSMRLRFSQLLLFV